MNRRTLNALMMLATALILSTGASRAAGLGTRPHAVETHPTRPMKMKGAGQIDLSNGAFTFSGVATHLGRYQGDGTVDLGHGAAQGTFTAANGDVVDWTAQFAIGPLGEIEATFTIDGGTGRFAGATGSASGPILLDPDLMFTFTVQGTIAY